MCKWCFPSFHFRQDCGALSSDLHRLGLLNNVEELRVLGPLPSDVSLLLKLPSNNIFLNLISYKVTFFHHSLNAHFPHV